MPHPLRYLTCGSSKHFQLLALAVPILLENNCNYLAAIFLRVNSAPTSNMSLGPPGLGFDPDKAENFEDVSSLHGHIAYYVLMSGLDGEAIRRQRYGARRKTLLQQRQRRIS